jgi:DNA primase catalytic subunit
MSVAHLTPACHVYTVAPVASHITDFRPVQRELVIDIDISDYDEVRTCGSGGHICNKCWPFMAVAIQVRLAGRCGSDGCPAVS